jgi:hypothetical protein
MENNEAPKWSKHVSGSVLTAISLGLLVLVGIMGNIVAGDNLLKRLYEANKAVFIVTMVYFTVLAIIFGVQSNAPASQSTSTAQPTATLDLPPSSTAGPRAEALPSASLPTSGPTQTVEDPDALTKLRAEHQVRPLTELENGLPLKRIPNGVYGFLDSAGLGFIAHGTDQGLMPLKSDGSDLMVEIHRLPDGNMQVVGFISAQDEFRLRDPSKRGPIDMMFLPRQYGTFTQLVSIPLPQLKVAEVRYTPPYIIDMQVDTSIR